jgi:hypothetical protein
MQDDWLIVLKTVVWNERMSSRGTVPIFVSTKMGLSPLPHDPQIGIYCPCTGYTHENY